MHYGCVALITARAGSKRLPGKNTRLFAGKPLIEWSIIEAAAARHVDDVFVSTDDLAAIDISRKAGALVPFVRPAELSTDEAPHYDVAKHFLNWMAEQGHSTDLLCILQPTSPLRIAADIDDLVDKVVHGGHDAGVTVSKVTIPPEFMLSASGIETAKLIVGGGEAIRKQDIRPLYFLNGAVYVIRPQTFATRGRILPDEPAILVMPQDRSIDIDEPHDFVAAEALMAKRQSAGD